MTKRDEREPIVVTGMGVVSCLGTGRRDFWDALLARRYGIRELTRLDVSQHRQTIGGEVKGFEPAPDVDPAIQFALAAAREAAAQAGLDAAQDRLLAGVVSGSNFGAMDAAAALMRGDAGALREGRFGSVAEEVARELDLRGFRSALSLSCASGSAAAGHAFDLLRAGVAGAFVVVACDSISELSWSGLTAIRTMTRKVIRPFDAGRDGTIFSEGAGAIVLETMSSAAARGVEPLAFMLGHAENNNAFHMAHPDLSGEGTARAMQAALDHAGLSADAVDHISAHGTGTRYNDSIETMAIKTVFGERASRIPVNSIKSMAGHVMGATAMVEIIASIVTMREGVIPPTINLQEPDPECDLDYVSDGPRAADVEVVLCNSAGIGGCNSVVVLRRAPRTPGEGKV